MARKKKGQKSGDQGAEGNASANPPGASGSSTSQDAQKKETQQGQQQKSSQDPQQPGQGAWQKQAKQSTPTQKQMLPQKTQPQQQGRQTLQSQPQQQGRQPQQSQPQQQGRQTLQSQPQQQGAWAAQSRQPQQHGPPPQHSQPQQQGAWAAQGRQPQQHGPPPQQYRPPPQQPQQQGAWASQGRQPQQHGPPPQQSQPQQQGAWAAQGRQPQQHGPPPQQQGAWAAQGRQPQQHGPPPEQSQQQQQWRPQQHRRGAQQMMQTQEIRPYQSQASNPLPEMQNVSITGRGGTQGKRIMVETNYLSFDFGKLQKAYHYDVKIDPDTPKRWLRQVFEIFRQKIFPNYHPAFDGMRNLYSPYELLPPNQVASDVIDFDVPNEGKKKQFKVTVQFAVEIDLSPLQNMKMVNAQQALQCLEIVMRSAPAKRCIPAGRSFFTKPTSGVVKLGDGMEMYVGFYQTAVRGWKTLFNVDVAHKAFPSKMNVIDLIAELASDYRRTYNREDFRSEELYKDVETKLLKHLKTLRVIYEIPGMKREYRVNGLDVCPRKKKFSVDGQTMTIEEYFQRKKNVRLNYPLMPTLWVGSVARQDRILLPAELCTVVENQAVNRKMNENQTSQMIKKAATSTEERKRKIMGLLETTAHNQNETVKEFGFRINNEFEKVEARVLRPPALEYAKGVESRPSKGVWRQDNNMFFRGAEAASWVIISLVGSNVMSDCGKLATWISGQSQKCGMRLMGQAGPFDFVKSRIPTAREVQDILEKHSKYNLIFVIIPDAGPVYSFVKKAAEIKMNCLTQCIKRRTLNKMNPSTVGNILLKVNSKLDGTNHCLKTKPSILNEACMIMGADVTHPSPDSQHIPSVVAVTASHDPKAMFGYNMCCRLQLPTVEIIEDLEAITREHLLYFFQKTNGQKPRRIICYRDGVSEGQFAEVKQVELSAIRRACTKMEADYQPKITFIVVQKRHHTRFFPKPQDSEDRNVNVPAGTCVDTQITSLNVQDFYLVSHASIQGVAKPTKYSTLWDDSDLSYDEIEQLSYYLCHLFSRCNRSVSYPAPTYYAHLGAARAKVYIENEPINFNNLQNEQKKLKNDSIRKDKPMFFV